MSIEMPGPMVLEMATFCKERAQFVAFQFASGRDLHRRGIDLAFADADFVMQMRTGGEPRHAAVSDDFTLTNVIALVHGEA